jgi:hypothetical protein
MLLNLIGQGVPDPVYGEERTHRYGSGALLDDRCYRDNKVRIGVTAILLSDYTGINHRSYKILMSTLSGELRELPAGAVNNEQGENK